MRAASTASGSLEASREMADQIDFEAKDLAEDAAREGFKNHDAVRKAMKLREEAARLYKHLGNYGNAGFSYRRAADMAFHLRDNAANRGYRRRAARCFDRAGMHGEAAKDLALYGEMLIKTGETRKGSVRESLIYLGISAVEEAQRKFREYGIPLREPARFIFEDIYPRAAGSIPRRDSREWALRMDHAAGKVEQEWREMLHASPLEEVREKEAEILSLRRGAAELFEETGNCKDAGFNYSRAAQMALHMNGRGTNLEMRRHAVRCFDKAGSQKNVAFDLALYGELMIRKARHAQDNERRFFMGIGMSAIEEADSRRKRFRIPMNRTTGVAFQVYNEALEEWKSEGLPRREEFWRGHEDAA
ncbi:MAG: hypothetical protein HYW25_03550 [Candidatus Aenigmarchaeota archaeon]|nr:hypothetical protein [Candidatus Aenigmarchaeota archaeon]